MAVTAWITIAGRQAIPPGSLIKQIAGRVVFLLTTLMAVLNENVPACSIQQRRPVGVWRRNPERPFEPHRVVCMIVHPSQHHMEHI